jgi:hypothetical protein
MIYFGARDELKHMQSLLAQFENIVSIERVTRERLRAEGAQYLGPYDVFKRIREESARSNPTYAELRVSYAKLVPRADKICDREGISWHRQGRAAPLEGGSAFQGSIFGFVLNRPSDLMDIDTDVRDTANQCIGVLERKSSKELSQLINPLYWIGKAVIWIVRLPYTILELSGFDVQKIQEHMIARLFQLLYVIGLIWILLRLGLSSAIDLGSLIAP